MKNLVSFAISLILLGFSSCSEVTYITFHQSQADPDYVFKRGTTIGLVPIFWVKGAKENNVDELSEKILLSYIKKELEHKGAKVFVIPIENLKEDDKGIISCINMEKYPDLTLTCVYYEKPGQVEIPAKTYGFIGRLFGEVSYRGAHSVNVYDLFIGFTLWSGPPEYTTAVWRASIFKGSPVPDLFEQARNMVHEFFLLKFLKKR